MGESFVKGMGKKKWVKKVWVKNRGQHLSCQKDR